MSAKNPLNWAESSLIKFKYKEFSVDIIAKGGVPCPQVVVIKGDWLSGPSRI